MGEYSLLIEWPAIIDEEILWDMLSYKNLIKERMDYKIQYANNAYNSLLIKYLDMKEADSEISDLKSLYRRFENIERTDSKSWHIPVCYNTKFGIDLEELAKNKCITTDTLINLHTQVNYRVYFMGFLPGFLYLGGLDNILHTPRKDTPRISVPKGAVAIGGEQTGIYPMESPGGWNIIGNTPIELFQKERANPCEIEAGDTVRFFSIDIVQYEKIKNLVKNGDYKLNYSAND